MERREYERLATVEEQMWWFRALHRNLIFAWRTAAPTLARPRLLDAGCGTGGLLRRLSAVIADGFLAGLDVDREVCAAARAKSGASVFVGSVDRLPIAADSFDAIFSADVLCHAGVDVETALRQFRHGLRAGGILILNLPAYRWLYSDHDRAVENARRFDRKELIGLLHGAGFIGIRARYWNGFLFPAMMLRRLLPRRRRSAEAKSDVMLFPRPIEKIFAAVTALESWAIGRGLSLPFGGSILATAIKP